MITPATNITAPKTMAVLVAEMTVADDGDDEDDGDDADDVDVDAVET